MINDKIEVFILTYNRSKLLEASIRSVLNQTVKTKLTVVDNHSTDDTPALIDRLRAEGHKIDFIVREKNGAWPGNFSTAREHMTYPYVLLFSDDDILHPQYIESALRIVNQNPDVMLVCSDSTPFYDNALPQQRTYKSISYYKFRDKKDTVSYTFAAQIVRPWETPLFPNTIYSRKYLENAVLLNGLYGKISDRPFILEGVEEGAAALIRESMLSYRLHAGSDSQNQTTACSHEELMRYMDYYRQQMQYCWKSRLIYALAAGRNLKAYAHFAKHDRSPQKLLWDAWRDGVFGILSAPMLFERLLHIAGIKADGIAEHIAIRLGRSLACVGHINLQEVQHA